MSILYVLNLQLHGSNSDVEGSRSVLGLARQASFSPARVTASTLSPDSTSPSLSNHPPCCPPTPSTTNQSATLLPGNNQSTPDSSTSVPTQTTINKKAKSRPLDKDSRNKNRLSHTSAPLFLSKGKRPPQPPDLSGATKRFPGGQQPPSRRQRSINTQDGNLPTCLSKLHILEMDQEIRTLDCSSSETCSFTVFLNRDRNSSMSYITLHMISSEEVWVWQCGATRGRLCPKHPEASFSHERSTYTAGTSHLWSLPVMPFQEVTYHFRVSHSSQPGCSSEDDVVSSRCPEYSFLIQTTC